jgi:di/tripeptidase
VNPALVPGGAGEGEIAAFVAGWARAAGLSADVLTGTAHAQTEWVSVSDTERVARPLVEVAARLCA